MKWPVLSSSTTTPEVGNWQRFLNQQGVTDWEGKTLKDDESFGQRTAYATRAWQVRQSLSPTGEVDALTRFRARDLGFIPFVQAAHFTRCYPQTRPIRLIVLHTMEAPEKPATNENVVQWFAGPSAPIASAHYCVGQGSVIQTVRDCDVAFHAPGANATGLGIEHEGYAKQTPGEWQDEASLAVLSRSAELVAFLCAKYNIPVVRLLSEDLRSGKAGICGHSDVSQAFKGSKHWDPGPGFPWADYLARVQERGTS